MRQSVSLTLELVVLALFVLCVVQPGNIPDPFGAGRFWSWTVLSSAVVAALVALQVSQRVFWSFRRVDWLLGAYLTCAVLAWPWSIERATTGGWIVAIAVQALLYLAVRSTVSRSAFAGRLVVVVAVLGIAWVQLEALDYHLMIGLSARPIIYPRPAGWSGYPELGFLALVQVSLLLGAWQEMRGLATRAAVTMLLALGLVELTLLYSRTALIAAGFVLAVAGIRAIRLGHARLYMAIALVVIVAGGVAVSRNQMASNILKSIVGLTRVDATASGRMDIWQRTGRMIADHPLQGVGLGNFTTLYLRRYQNPKSWDTGRPVHAHNLWLHQAAELGVPGGLVFAALWVAFLLTGARRTLARRGSSLVAACAFLAVVGIAIRSVADNMFFEPGGPAGRLASLTWICLALLTSGATEPKEGRMAGAAGSLPDQAAAR